MATIGYGYTFNRSDNYQKWISAGIVLSEVDAQLLREIDAAPAANRTALGLQFPRRLTEQEATSLLEVMLIEQEAPLNTAVGGGVPISVERAALLSALYGLDPTRAPARYPGLFDALQKGDRAETWFNLRYHSFRVAENLQKGIRKRRYMESTAFGLYENQEAPSYEDAKNVLQMFSLHREEICQQEKQWGVSIEGVSGPGGALQLANADSRYADVRENFGNVLALEELLNPARQAFIEGLAQEELELSMYWDTSQIKSTSIYVDAGRESAASEKNDSHASIIDARNTKNSSGGELVRDDLIVGWGGEDKLYGGKGNDVLVGGKDADVLDGGEGEDLLSGGDGNDRLTGGDGKDRLLGGYGDDIYLSDKDDVIRDVDGLGSVYLSDERIAGGTRKTTDPQNVYKDANTGTTYVLNGNNLTVNGGLVIENFHNDDLGIHLETIPEDPPPPPPGGPTVDPAEQRRSPIVIDLDGDGVETQALRYDIHFDHDANGMRESTAWVGADDGLLVRDLDDNGRIDTGRELFGTNTLLQDGQRAANGYEALKELDENRDGVVDAADAGFAQLRVWRDANSDGITDAGELLTLEQAGIVSLGTGWTASTEVDANGQLHAQVGTATRADGTTAATSDVWFQVDTTHRVNALPLAENWRDVIELPDAKAFGNLPDLHQAMANDPVLKGLVEAFVAEQDPAQREAMLEGLIYQWAGVANVDPGSRDPTRVYGHVMDARQLIVLETLVGRGYQGTWCWGERDPNPHGNAAPLLIAEFKKFQGFVRAQLLAQADRENYAFIKGGFSSGYDGVLVDWQRFQATADALHAQGNSAKLEELIDVLRGLGTYSERVRFETEQAFALLQVHHPDLSVLFDTATLYGSAGNDSLFGDDQDQVILADKGDDLLFGGAGNDSYFYRIGDGQDRIYDSEGIDQLVFMEGIAASDISVERDLTSIIFKISAGGTAGEVRIDNVFDENGNLREGVIESVHLNDGTVWSLPDVLSRIPSGITAGDDTIYATTGDDIIAAQDGDDQLLGLGGNDVLRGEGGNDTITGGNGDDVLDGGSGNDVLNGGAGNDTYVFAAGFGQDVIENYDDQADRLDRIEFAVGIAATDASVRRVGDDLLLAFSNGDSVTVARHFEGDGASQYSINEVRFADGTTWNVATLNAKALEGTAGDDVLVGFASDDVIHGLEGDDVIDGGDGNDTLSDGAGNDVLRGGNGNDTIYFTAGAEPGGVDIATGGAGDDVYHIARGSGTDRIAGLAASDAGIDRVVMDGIGTELIRDYRISGNDLFLFIGEAGGNAVENTVVLEGFMRYDAPSHVLEFAGGVTMTRAEFTTHYWNGTSGDDVNEGSFSPDNMDGGEGNDTLSGGMGADRISGGAGDDIIHGNAGNDVLDGGTGEDYIYGDEGDDVIVSGAHRYGGVGDDTYEYLTQFSSGAYEMYGSSGVVELDGEGNDTVVTNYYNFTLNSTSVENLVVKQVNYVYSTWDGKTVTRKIVGNELDNTIRVDGAVISNVRPLILLDGGLGNDTMIGSEADETYVVDSMGDSVVEPETSNSDDTVRASISYSIENRPEIENVELTADDTVAMGNAGDNRLDGSMATGANTLIGGDGNDTYIVDSNDTVVEADNGGVDTVVIRKLAAGTTTFYVPTQSNNIEVYQLHHDAGNNVNLVGSDRNDILVGNDSANTLSGGEGDDELRSGGNGTWYSDYLNGGAGDDLLIGGSGNVVLSGGTGNDELRLGSGNETVRFERGDGSDMIVSVNGNTDGMGTVQFGASIDPDNVIWSRDGNDLVLTFADLATDQMRIRDYWVQEAGVDALSGVVDRISFYNEPGYRSGVTLEALRNKAPVSNYGHLDAQAIEGQAFVYALPVDAFSDEAPEALVCSVEGLPAWLSFDQASRTFQGTPPDGETEASVQITATDVYGASTTLQLELSVIQVIQGSTGNDTLNGADGAHLLYGGEGDDHYILDVDASGETDDSVIERPDEGVDEVFVSGSYALADNVENLTLTGDASVSGEGNALDNVITGNNAANELVGGDGNDTLLGKGGSDSLYGGEGDDLLDGGSGSDRLYGGAGNDTLKGGMGNDAYILGRDGGDDVIDNTGGGEDGIEFDDNIAIEELAFTRDGDDLVIAVAGDTASTVRVTGHFLGGELALDYVALGKSDVLDTAAINALADPEGTGGDEGNDGNAGNDDDYPNVVEGTSAGEQLLGSSGRDLLNGLGGDDQLFGFGGDDKLVGGDGNDYLAGGNGSGSGSGSDILQGGSGNDTLSGEDGDNVLIGGAGDDKYVYGGGRDTIDNTGGGIDWLFFNGIGRDHLGFHRDGDDLVVMVDGDANRQVRVQGHFLGGDLAIDYIQPGSGYAITAAQIEALLAPMPDAGDGDTPPTGDGGHATPPEEDDGDYGNVVDGTAAGEQLLGSSGRDLIHGLAGDDTLFGFGGDDKLEGGDGADYLSGGNGSFNGSGDDILIGGAGNDTLVGEDGNDLLIGGSGDDTYYYAQGSGADTVDNTGGGTDWLYFAGIAANRLHYHRDGDDLLVTVDGDLGQSIRVQGHFLGGDKAISYVQPGSGYAIPASQIPALLTPMPAAQTTGIAASGSSSAGMLLADSGAMQGVAVSIMAPSAGRGMSEDAKVGILPGGCLPPVTPRWQMPQGGAGDLPLERLQEWLEAHGRSLPEGWPQTPRFPTHLPEGWQGRFSDRRYLGAETAARDDAMDSMYRNLAETIADERSVRLATQEVGGTMSGVHAELAGECQRLIAALALSDAHAPSLAANCESWRRGAGVEMTVF